MDPISIALGLAQFAPSILRFFGAGEKPVAVAEKVVGIAQQVTGAQTPEEALQRMRADAQMQHEFQMKMLEQDAELEKAYLADRQNARARDIEFIKAGRPNLRGDILAYCAIGALILSIVLAYTLDLSGPQQNILSALIGALVMLVKDVYGFEFGASKEGARAANVVSEIAKS